MKSKIEKEDLFNLYKELSKLTDARRQQGKRHHLKLVVILVILSIMSGYDGYHAIGDFIKKNQQELIKMFKPKKNRLPSFSTVRRVLKSINFDELCVLFEKWALAHIEIKEKEWISLDGKAIKGTENKHKFVNLVSLFCIEKKQVFSMGKVDDKSNEIPKVQELIEKFPVQKVIYRMYAMHCQKKTVKKIIEKDSFYVLDVKENQKALLKKVKFICRYFPVVSSDVTEEKNRGRLEKREVCVYKEGLDLKHSWDDLKYIIKVKRTVKTKGKESEEIAYFIANLDEDAGFFNKGIRQHWRIENSLHYVKDVTLNEDRSRIRTGNAPQNISLLRTFVINVLRKKGYPCIKQAIRLLSGNMKLMLSLF